MKKEKIIRIIICIMCSVCVSVFSGCEKSQTAEDAAVNVSEIPQSEDTSVAVTEPTAETAAETVSVKSIIEYEGDFGFKKVGDDLVLAKYTGDGGYAEIPEGVTRIGYNAFSQKVRLKAVRLPESLEAIEDKAFINCTGLKSVVFPDSLKEIGKQAFGYTGLESVVIPESVTKIGEKAFIGCSFLKSAEFRGSMEEIPDGVFARCPLNRVEFPEGLKRIGAESLISAEFTELHIPDGVEEIGESALGSIENIYLPNSIKKLGAYFIVGGCNIYAEAGNAEIEKLSGNYNLILKDETAYERYNRLINKKGIFCDINGDGSLKVLTVDEDGILKIYNSKISDYNGSVSLTLAEIANTQHDSVYLDGTDRKLYRLKNDIGEEFLLFTLLRDSGRTAEALELYYNGVTYIYGNNGYSGRYSDCYILQNTGGQSFYEYAGENGEPSYASVRNIGDIYDISYGKCENGTEKDLAEEFEKTISEYISRYEIMGEYDLEKYIAAQGKENITEDEKLIGEISEVSEESAEDKSIDISKKTVVKINGKRYYISENSVTVYVSNSYPQIDFDALAEFENLTELTVISSRKVSLDGVGKLKNLKSLSLEIIVDGGFTDFGEIYGLDLKRLCLRGDFDSLDFCGGCTDVEMLLLAPASVHENGYYSFIEKMSGLKLVTLTFDGKFGGYYFSGENEKYIRENIGEAFAETVLSGAELRAEENSGGEEKESGGFMWGSTEITEFPYRKIEYPAEMSIEVCGNDILRGESVEGVSFKDGVLTLDNVNIVYDKTAISFSGIDNAKIRLIGDNVVDSLYSRSINVKNINSDLEIFGDGTLTVREVGSPGIGESNSHITISENARLIGADKYDDEKAKTAKIAFKNIYIKDNGAAEFDEINCGSLFLTDSAYLKAARCSGYFMMYLSGSSVMEVIGDPGDYEKYKDTYSDGRTIDCVKEISIRDSARLSVTNYCHEAIFGYPNLAKVKVSGNGVLEITGNPYAIALCLDEGAFGTLTMNDNSRVEINNALACISAKKVEINGGTLVCNACEGGYAVLIDHIVSPYADFVPGIFINGEITEISCGEMEIGKTDDLDYFYPLQSEGNILESFSVTVREKQDQEE